VLGARHCLKSKSPRGAAFVEREIPPRWRKRGDFGMTPLFSDSQYFLVSFDARPEGLLHSLATYALP